MKTFLNSLAGTIAGIVILIVICASLAGIIAGNKEAIEDRSWLVIPLYGDLPEYDPPGGIMSKITGGDTETLTRVLENFRKAQVDDRIAGVILKVAADTGVGVAAIQEMRAAIKRFQKAGKKVYGYAESFDARRYYLLAAADEIIVPETAYIDFTGLASNTLHVKLALDKLGIVPNIHKIRDYKSAAELVTRTDMSVPARENMKWLLADFWDLLTRDLAQDRGFDEGKIVKLMEHALFIPQRAKEDGLVDRIMYWDQVEAMLKGEDDDDLRTVSPSRYAEVSPASVGLKGRKTIAIVHAQGMIIGRKNGMNPMLGMTMGHETICAELRRAREDEDVAAVIFRVDSGGGDGLSSDLMSREVEATAAVKPVVVSMVDMAASGGYWIAYKGSKIVADPTTITASIGSISGKFNMSAMWAKLGVTHDVEALGPNALLDSSWRNYTPEERKRFEEDHWEGFNNWLRDVARRRGMSFEAAEKLAHGRVYTGREAQSNGLIDEVGDLDHAILMAKDLAGIPADEKVNLVHYPETKSLVESILSGDVATAARWAVYRAVREDVVQTWQVLQRNPALVLGGGEP